MDATSGKDSGADAVLQGAMMGALNSGMTPSQLLAIAMAVVDSNVPGVLKDVMNCALDGGMKPDTLINVAVEAFKNQNPPSKQIVCAEQPAHMNNAIEHEPKLDKPVSSDVEVAVANQNSSLKRAASTEWPRTGIKTITTTDGRKHKTIRPIRPVPDCPDISDSELGMETLRGIRIVKWSSATKPN